MRIWLSMMACLSVGCTSTHKNVGMVVGASATAEPHVVWTRPLEVGFEMGRYIEAESTTRRLFGCIRVDGDPVQKNTHVPMMGVHTEFSNGSKMAVARAVKESNADGMYILFIEEDVQWSGLVNTTTTTVRGRALKLEDFGSVDQERATQVRIQEAGSTGVAR